MCMSLPDDWFWWLEGIGIKAVSPGEQMRLCEKPREAPGKCAAYAGVEAQGLERVWGEAQAWSRRQG